LNGLVPWGFLTFLFWCILSYWAWIGRPTTATGPSLDSSQSGKTLLDTKTHLPSPNLPPLIEPPSPSIMMVKLTTEGRIVPLDESAKHTVIKLSVESDIVPVEQTAKPSIPEE